MGKKLSEMSLEELWQLFPIILTRHQDCWKKWYLEEESVQFSRDRRKDRLLQGANIKILRLPTTSMDCKEKIIAALRKKDS